MFDVGHARVVEELYASNVDDPSLWRKEEKVDHLTRRPYEPVELQEEKLEVSTSIEMVGWFTYCIDSDELLTVFGESGRQALTFEDTKT